MRAIELCFSRVILGRIVRSFAIRLKIASIILIVVSIDWKIFSEGSRIALNVIGMGE